MNPGYIAGPPALSNLDDAEFWALIRTATLLDDVRLLGDVADAFKHHKLGRKTATITGAKAIVTLANRLWRDA
jgi:hypothetical protein